MMSCSRPTRLIVNPRVANTSANRVTSRPINEKTPRPVADDAAPIPKNANELTIVAMRVNSRTRVPIRLSAR
jgi:hypothetical protein